MENFKVTKDMDIEAEKAFRLTLINTLKITIAGQEALRELASMSDDRYVINNMRAEHASFEQNRLQELLQEIKILERGYIAPEVIELATKLYAERGGNFDTAGDSVQNSWVDIAKYRLK